MVNYRTFHIARALGVFLIAITLSLSAISSARAESAYELRQSWQRVAELVATLGQDEEAARIIESVNALSNEELERVYSQARLDSMISALEQIQTAIDTVESLDESISVKDLISGNAPPQPVLQGTLGTDITLTSNGFPTSLDYPNPTYCPLSPGRSNGLALQIAVDAIQAARIALEAAKVIWSGLSRACDQTAVVAGVGGNTSLACIPADIVLFAAELVVGAAEGVVEHFIACDNGVDSAEIAGTWQGLVHVNGVLEGHVDQLTTHDTTIKSQLLGHDGDIKSELDVINAKLDVQNQMLQAMLENQRTIIDLLKTPQGRRPGWNDK